MNQQTPSAEPSTVDPAAWLERHGDWLYRFALLRVQDTHLAEDLVQDTLVAAWHGRETYSGAAAERTWLTAILRNKVISHFRRAKASPVASSAEDGPQEDTFFSGRGHWNRKPDAWSIDPDQLAEKAEFWQVFRNCLSKLPQRVAQVYALREIDSLETEKVCEVLGVSANNVWTQLHRARLLMRRCLEQHWFAPVAGRKK